MTDIELGVVREGSCQFFFFFFVLSSPHPSALSGELAFVDQGNGHADTGQLQ